MAIEYYEYCYDIPMICFNTDVHYLRRELRYPRKYREARTRKGEYRIRILRQICHPP